MLTPGPLRFRDATEADLEALLALVTSAYRGDASRVGWTTEADLLDGERIDRDVLLADMRQPRSRVLLAERGDELLACAHVAELGGGGYFGMFAVRPERQGGGLGKSVLAEAERVVREEWNLPVIRMTVIDVRDELIAWYQRRGYRRTGISKPFPLR